MTAGGLTILTTKWPLVATKKFTWHPPGVWHKTSYGNAREFYYGAAYEMAGVDDLASVIQQIAADPRNMVIRGALSEVAQARIEANPHALVNRRKKARGGIEPDFIEVPRQWMMVDIDNFRMRTSDDLADDPNSAVRYAIEEILPDCFQDVRCFWQLSSSAGFEPGMLKVHLFYWLTKPLICAALKRALEQHAPGITDRSIYQGVQPHYIATPIIEGGPDPIPRRFGWIKGSEDVVALPPLKAEEPRQRSPGGTNAGASASASGDPLERLGDGEGLHGFHEPLRSACWNYAVRSRRFGDRDDKSFIQTLKNAIDAAPRRPDRDIGNYVDGDYLQRSIDGAFARLADQDDLGPIPPHPAAGAPAPPEADPARRELGSAVVSFLARTTAWHRAKAAYDAASR
jgi:hypothetical protein